MKTYRLDAIAAAVRAVAPEVEIFYYPGFAKIGQSLLFKYGEVDTPNGRIPSQSFVYVITKTDRAIVRAIMDELDAQDVTGGEGA